MTEQAAPTPAAGGAVREPIHGGARLAGGVPGGARVPGLPGARRQRPGAVAADGQGGGCAAGQQPRRVVVRKVEDDYVITKVIPAQQIRSRSRRSPRLTTGASGGGTRRRCVIELAGAGRPRRRRHLPRRPRPRHAHVMSEHDVSFPAMGSEMRLLIGEPTRAASAGTRPRRRQRAREYVEQFDARLSRFRSDSELCALNADQREAVPASPLLRSGGGGRPLGGRAQRRPGRPHAGGPAIEAAGYRESRKDVAPAPARPRPSRAARRGAAPRVQHPGSRWRAAAGGRRSPA